MSKVFMDSKNLMNGLLGFENKFDRALRMYADTSSKLLEGDAKVNARWTDRSGAARQRLTSDYIKTSEGYKLRLMHNVHYGIWLELAHEKRYAIILETIRLTGTFEIIPGLNRLLDRLGVG